MSLTMTYFHGGGPTIIGAVLFHGPVRDGKGWFQDAMVVRLQLVCVAAFGGAAAPKGKKYFVGLRDCLASVPRSCKVIGSSRTGN